MKTLTHNQLISFLSFLFFLTLRVTQVSGQPRVDYLDKTLNVVAASDMSSYQREINRNDDGTYSVVVKFRSGETKMHGTYLDESLETETGKFEYFFANGVKESEGEYRQGIKRGNWKRWDFEGNARPDRYYPEGPEMNGGSAVAEFPGGDQALVTFIETNMKYPQDAMNANVEGMVFVAFHVNLNGELTQIEVMQGVNTAVDAEALRLVSNMPLWKPAMKNGENRESQFILPISFDIERYKDLAVGQ